jgi:hypothetical protein
LGDIIIGCWHPPSETLFPLNSPHIPLTLITNNHRKNCSHPILLPPSLSASSPSESWLSMSQSRLLNRCSSLSPLGNYYGGYRVGDRCPGYVPKTKKSAFVNGYRPTCNGTCFIREIPDGTCERPRSNRNPPGTNGIDDGKSRGTYSWDCKYCHLCVMQIKLMGLHENHGCSVLLSSYSHSVPPPRSCLSWLQRMEPSERMQVGDEATAISGTMRGPCALSPLPRA